MPLTTISGEIQAQPLNDNFSYLNERINDFVVNVKEYGAVGNGITDDTLAVQNAINAVNAAGGGIVEFPAGTYLVGKLTIYNECFLVGKGRGVSSLKLKSGTNDNLVEGYLSTTLWGTNSTAGLTHYGLKDIELDGNRAANTAGSTFAVYGQEPYLLNVAIKNSPEHGMRTEWYDGADEYGMEGYIANVKIDTCGKHGWWFKGPHDTTAISVIIIDAGQLLTNTYDGLLIEGTANGRFIGCHVWNKSTSLRHRYALNDSAGGSDFIGCHFEGAYSANVYANGQNSLFSGSKFYAAWNGVNVLIKQPSINFKGCFLSDPGVGRPTCKGIVLGNAAGDNIINCDIDIHTTGQEAGVIDFTYSDGFNTVKVRGYNAAGVAYVGTPHVNDDVNILVSGINVDLVQKQGKFFAIDGIGVGNSLTASTTGSVVRKIEVFDSAGSTLGFLPVYNSIT